MAPLAFQTPLTIHFTSGTNSPCGIRSWKCLSTAVSPLGTEIASVSPLAVLNSTTYVPSSFGPKIMIRFLPTGDGDMCLLSTARVLYF